MKILIKKPEETDEIWYLYSRIFNHYLYRLIGRKIGEEEFNLKVYGE